MNDPLIWQEQELVAFTHDPDDRARSWAWERLVLLHPEEAGRHAARGLRDPLLTVRSRAFDAFTKRPSPEARNEIEALVQSGALPPGLHERAHRMLRGEPNPEPIKEAFDLEVERLAADPEELRRRAPGLLASTSHNDPAMALFALGRQPYRWATEIILSHLPRLLATSTYKLSWDALRELGDPAALPAMLDAWRPGEQLIAALAERIHRLARSEGTLPEGLVRDAEAHKKGLAGLMDLLRTGGDPLKAGHDLRLDLRCTQCSKVGQYDVLRATVHPDPKRCEEEGWDGVVLGRIIVCKYCGAEDSYELTGAALAVLVAYMIDLKARPVEKNDGSPAPRIEIAELSLWDGSICRRPTQALRHLRELAEREPGRGEGWRRLGNLYQRYERKSDAVEAWLRAADDENEMEACYALTEYHADEGRTQEAFTFARKTIERMRGKKDAQPRDIRRAMADYALDFIHSVLPITRDPVALMVAWSDLVPGMTEAVVNLSSVDLRKVRRWDRLADLFGSESFVFAKLTPELPEEEPTRLGQLLESGRGLPSLGEGRPAAPRSSGPKIARNGPCPCGSGKKFKKCCGR